jgi:hypothetical protein
MFPGVWGLTLLSYICWWTYGPAEYIHTVYTVYIHFWTVYICFYPEYVHFCPICKYLFIFVALKSRERLTSIVFGMVHSDRTVLVLICKHFSSRVSTICNSISLIVDCTCATMRECSLMAYVSSLFIFYKSAYYI